MIEKWVAEALAEICKSAGLSDRVHGSDADMIWRVLNGKSHAVSTQVIDTIGVAIQKVCSLPKTSNAFNHEAFKLWRAFHSDDKPTPDRWFFMEEKSRAKWTALTEKVVAAPAAKPDMIKREGPFNYVDELTAKNKAAIDSALMASVSTAFNEANHASLLRHLGFPVQPPKTLAERQLDRIREMPPIIRAMSQNSLAWIVGSRAEFRPEKLRVNQDSDWDVLVPFSEWQDAMTRLAAAGALECATHTSVGGIRTVIPAKNGGTVKLDIWPGEISSHMMKPFTNVAWQPKTGAVWVRQH